MNETLNTFGVIVAIAISIAGWIVTYSRSKSQNNVDTASYVRNMEETSALTIKARLDAEKRAEIFENELKEVRKMLNSMAYRVTFIVHTGDDPRIEKISVERFANRRMHEEHIDIERRKA